MTEILLDEPEGKKVSPPMIGVFEGQPADEPEHEVPVEANERHS